MKLLSGILIYLAVSLHAIAQTETGFVTVNDGKLYFEKSGKGPPIVFLHGVCLDHRMWEDQVKFFSETYTCITMDIRGFGKSTVPLSTFSFHTDLNALLDSLHVHEPVVLVACSMGGKGAINFSLMYPEKTKALILADVAVDGYVFKEFKLEKYAEIAQKQSIDIANQSFLDNPVFKTARSDSSVFRRLQDMILSYSGWMWIHKNPVQGLTPPAIQQLENIKKPVLIITGENDIDDFQNIANTLHQGIPHSVKKEITAAGHICSMEKPNTFNEMVYAFLKTIK